MEFNLRRLPLVLSLLLALAGAAAGAGVAAATATTPDPATTLPPAQGPYRILMLLPFGPPSHRNCFLPLAEALASRGHKVVILSGLPGKSKHPNVTEVNHGLPIMDPTTSMFEVRENDPTKGFGMFKEVLPRLARDLYDVPSVKDLYDNRHRFDLFIIDELFNEPAYPFLAGANYASIGTAGVLPVSSAMLGNVLNPSFVPAITVDYVRPYSFLQRANNLFAHLFMPVYWRHLEVFPLIEKEFSSRFPSLPRLAEIERGQVLSLANTHFSLDFAMPLLPSQVEVGGMHCRPGKQLPNDLKSFIEGSGPAGVLYFSLGSVCKSSTIPDKYKRVLVEAFRRLDQFRVVWKFEEDFGDALPPNVLIRDWLPQQDILAHPKVKLFLTHGGLLSMQEAVFHGKPLLALPVFGDQERNAQRIANKGIGAFLLWEELTVDALVATVQDLVRKPEYSARVSSISAAFRDQPRPPLDTAVWWTEYVIRHQGAPQLRSPSAALSWIEFLNVDILLAVHLALFLLYWGLKKGVCRLAALCRGKGAAGEKVKRH